jgi:quercetin dioxygenase-like cupin family protein
MDQRHGHRSMLLVQRTMSAYMDRRRTTRILLSDRTSSIRARLNSISSLFVKQYTGVSKMKSTRMMAAAMLFVGGLLLQAAQAQTAGVHRTDLVRHDISVPDREGIQVRVDLDPGAFAPMHSHPGEEIAYVLQGTLEYQLGNNTPVTLKAGESLFIPAGTAHSARNVGSGTASELATYVVKKGAPLVIPAR